MHSRFLNYVNAHNVERVGVGEGLYKQSDRSGPFFMSRDSSLMSALVLTELEDAILIPAFMKGLLCSDNNVYFFTHFAAKEGRLCQSHIHICAYIY
jgi:hypothetical protein